MRKKPSQMITPSFLHAVSYSDLCAVMLGEFAQWVKGEFLHWKVSNSLIVGDCKSCNYISLNTNEKDPKSAFP